MPFDDDDPGGSAFGGPPLPPEDRLWRHPSEMGPDRPEPGRGSRWIPVVAAIGGAGLAVAGLTLAGSVGGMASEDPAVIERVAAPAVATVPVVGGDPVEPVPVETAYLVTVESTGERTGSGFVLRSDGHVVTAASTVGEDEQVQVVAHDGQRGSAAVVGRDPVSGVAVLAVGWLAGRPGAVLGSLRSLEIGDPVTTTGGGDTGANPRFVSDLSATTTAAGEPVHGLVRTTGPLSPDGAGGPVLNEEGHVVGVALWADPSPATWAVPIDLVRRVADDIIGEGRAHHAWLGVEGEDGTAGPMLQSVTPDSPADRAGLLAGDVLTEVNGRPVAAMADVILALRELRPGDRVTIAYHRDDRTRHCTAELDELES
jgi:putative serine protease PepD